MTGWAASLARERVWSPDQEIVERGDVTRLSFWSTSEPEVVALVLSFGDNARVLEPPAVVDMVTGEHAGALGLYGVGED